MCVSSYTVAAVSENGYIGVKVLGCIGNIVPRGPTILTLTQQKLSYSKQIARQLRTQYVEDINSNPVTLKSTLRVTKGNWKRNHWIDRT